MATNTFNCHWIIFRYRIFSVESKKINTDKVNDILRRISKEVKNIKAKRKGGGKL